MLLGFLAIICVSALGQANNNKKKKGNVQREEVQRYFGYEHLLPAYMTLPVDATQNTNERGYFVETGYVFLILLPILLLFKLRRKNKFLFLFFLSFFVCLSGIYVSTSYIMGDQLQKVEHGSITGYSQTNASFFEDILCQFYISLNYLGELFTNLFSKISGTSDYITYPILVTILIGLFIYFEKSDYKKKNLRLVQLTLIFFFFWLILSSGIPWYGFLLIFLFSTLVILVTQNSNSKTLKTFSYSIIGTWILISFVTRISFVSLTPNINVETTGRSIINSFFFNRSLGNSNEAQLLNRVHPSLDVIQKTINRERSSLILQIGTTLGYFIDNNSDRCLLDFQLGFTDRIIDRYKTKEEILRALKASGFRYILIDLNTHTLDRTPEQTLTNKFRRLLNFVSNNNKIKLLGTDRVIENPNKNQAQKYVHGLGGTVVQRGSYAVFEIL